MTTFVPPVRRITYGKGHRYKDGNGTYITGTTTWLDKGSPKPELAAWRGRTVAECAVNEWADIADMPIAKRLEYLRKAPDRQSDRAKARGTEVHLLAEALTHGEQVIVPEHLRGHVESMVRLLDDWDIQALAVEATIYNLEHEWAGTCDVLGTARGRRGYGLVDWKTGSGVYGDYFLQLNCYANGTHYIDALGRTHPMPPIDWGLIGWIRPDGYDMYEVPITAALYRTFRYIQQIATWSTDISKSIKGPALAPPVEAPV